MPNLNGKNFEVTVDVRDEHVSAKSQMTVSPMPDHEVNMKETVTGEAAPDPTVEPEEELIGNGPDRAIVHHYRSNKPLWRFVRRVIKTIRARWFSPRTHEQRVARSLAAQRKAEKKILEQEKKDILILFENEFYNHGLYHRKKNGAIKRLRVRSVNSSIEAHYIRIDTRHRPEGVYNDHLKDEALIRDLCIDLQRPVSVRIGEDIGGTVFRVDRGGNRAGVPEHCMFLDALQRLPQSADGLAIILGLAQNSRLVWASLAGMPHLIIGGKSGRGKSNIIKAIIGTLIMRNTPDSISIMLIDVKRTDLKVFGGLPHLMHIPDITDEVDRGIVKDREKVLPALRHVQAEMNRRFKLIDGENDRSITNISDYNQRHRRNRLKRVVVIFDEIGALRDEKGIGDEIEGVMTNLVEMGRSAGIHLVMATQTLTSRVIPTAIKNNCAKLAFFCPNIHASIAVLGDGAATNIVDKPGRAIADIMAPVEIQTPLMTPDIIKEIVEAGMAGADVNLKARHDVTIQEILMWALANRAGRLTLQGDDGVYTFFRKRGISRDEISDWLNKIEGQEVLVNDVLYRVEAGTGKDPRRLVAVDRKENTAS